MTTHVDTAGRGDDFTATAHCSACGWSRTFVLADDGSFETAVTAAESAAALHAAAAARLAADAFDTDNERFGPQDDTQHCGTCGNEHPTDMSCAEADAAGY